MNASIPNAEVGQLLANIIPIAQNAGQEIMSFYGGEFEVRNKEDKSPVTTADENAEAIIVDGLKSLTPNIPIVAEEAMDRGVIPDVSGGRFWLVDPLDGTKEFVNHREEFTVNIGLVDNSTPALGVVVAPALATTYSGSAPGTAFVQRGTDAPQPISARITPVDGGIVTASRSHSDMKKIQQLMKNLSIKRMKISGSSIKFCLIAEGKADIYPRYGHTREWDTAAGHAVLRAAGGSVRTPDGNELIYNKEKFLNDEFIARGHDE